MEEDLGASWFCSECKHFPHDMDCAELRRIVAIERAGYCSQCGAEKPRAIEWDGDMQCVVEAIHCPNGHGSELNWIYAEHADQRDLDQLGVVRAE